MARITDRVRERVWHQLQVAKERSDGSLELTLRVDNLEEVERWVLGWGAQVEVIAPCELIDRVRDTADQVRKLFRR